MKNNHHVPPTTIQAAARHRALADVGLTRIEALPWMIDFDHAHEVDRICTRNLLGNKASSIWIERPNLRDAVIRLSSYVTPLYPGKDKFLLEEAAVAAIRAYETSTFAVGGVASEVAFLQQLAVSADALMRYQAVAVGSEDGRLRFWDVWNESLPEWLQSGRYDAFYLRDRETLLLHEREGARMALTSRLVGHRELGILELNRRRSGFGEAA